MFLKLLTHYHLSKVTNYQITSDPSLKYLLDGLCRFDPVSMITVPHTPS